jgi:hypothetical protein
MFADDDFIDSIIRSVDEQYSALRRKPMLSSYGRPVPPEEVDLRVTPDGYVRSSSKYGKHMFLILGFTEVCQLIEEEIRRERGEQS